MNQLDYILSDMNWKFTRVIKFEGSDHQPLHTEVSLTTIPHSHLQKIRNINRNKPTIVLKRNDIQTI